MNIKILLAALTAMPLMAGAQDTVEFVDTVVADTVAVVDESFGGFDDDPGFTFEGDSDPMPFPTSIGNDRWSITSNNLGFGLISAQKAPRCMGLEMGKSWEISWLDMLAVEYRPIRYGTLIMGVGMDWRNFKTSDGSARFYSDGGNVTYGPFQDGVTPVNSRLKVTTLGLSLRWRQSTGVRFPWGGRMNFEAGAIFNLTTHASLKTRWKDADGNEVEEYNKGLNYRRFTVDLYGRVAFCRWASVYVRYSPMSVLRKGGSPEFYPLSTGIMLNISD